MALGRKTGGRQKGTPNRRTAEVTERLAELGCDPIEGMAAIAMDPQNSPELRGKMFAELAQYVACKRRAVDGGQEEERITFQFNLGAPVKPDEDAQSCQDLQSTEVDHSTDQVERVLQPQ